MEKPIICVSLLNFDLKGVLISIVCALTINGFIKISIVLRNLKKVTLKFNFKVTYKVLKKGFLYSTSLFLSANQKTIPVIVMTGLLPF